MGIVKKNKIKCLCVIKIESNPGHYNNGIIDCKRVHSP